MPEHLSDTVGEPAVEIRIVRLVTDKTRKAFDSDVIYHVYFELSEYPPGEWRSLFERAWKKLDASREASIDGIFLVVHCPLDEIGPTQLPALKDVVVATNEEYNRHARKEATALKRREDVWKLERKEVDAIAAPLRFDDGH
jgi:hypothetical protein